LKNTVENFEFRPWLQCSKKRYENESALSVLQSPPFLRASYKSCLNLETEVWS